MENIILASQSPRRQEILSLGGYEYKVCVSSAEEQIPPEELENLTPQELVEKLARVKAEDVYRRNCSKNMEKSTTDNQAADSVEEITVIGADTVVAVDGCVLGKPKTEDEAKQMGDEYVSVEHIMLAILNRPNNAMKDVFQRFGIEKNAFLTALSSVRGNTRVTSDTPETSASLEKLTTNVSAMPTNIKRNCSIKSGIMRFRRSLFVNS